MVNPIETALATPATITHYENFPVASWLCPPTLRPAIAAIYHFARTADDIADEGDASATERLQALADYRVQLSLASVGTLSASNHPESEPQAISFSWDPRWAHIFAPLQAAIARFNLPATLLHDLLDAFVLDIENTRDCRTFATEAHLLDYCRLSANPVGRLLLHLYGVTDGDSLKQSDAICSALQLINFWQDPSVDIPRGRYYFTDSMREQHGVSLRDMISARPTPAMNRMVAQCVTEARRLMLQGAPLVHRVPGRAGWELRLVVQGGLRILDRIEAQGFTTIERRPALRKIDMLVMAWRSFWM